MYLEKPIITGKLVKESSNEISLIGGIDQVQAINIEDYEILNLMRGFLTFKQLSMLTGDSYEKLTQIYDKYKDDYWLRLLRDWNKLHWCGNCRVYINTHISTCPHCHNNLINIPIMPPCDPVFCFGDDYIFIKRLIESRLNANINGDLFLLINTGLYRNTFFWEVIFEGLVILKIEFNGLAEQDWKYTFSRDFKKIDWSKRFPNLKDERERHIHANWQYINNMEQKTQSLIKHIFHHLMPNPNDVPLVFFSGGKESIVMFDIFKKKKFKCQLLFAATGIDFPDDEQFIKELSNDREFLGGYSLHIEYADKKHALDLLNERGMLNPANMWCRHELKYPIRNQAALNINGNNNYIACEGSRKYENDFRRQHPTLNFLNNIKGYKGDKQIWLHPLAYWNGFDIWAYIFKNNLRINPLYYKGFHRTTCWLCPLVNAYHLNQSFKYYEGLWNQIEKNNLMDSFSSFSQWDNPF